MHDYVLQVSKILAKSNETYAPVCPVKIARKHGITVRGVEFSGSQSDIAGRLIMTDDGSPVIEFNSSVPGSSRQRMIVAEMLGHFFLGHGSSVSLLSQERTRKDREAYRFGLELLMPQRFLAHAIMEKHLEPLAASEHFAVEFKDFVAQMKELKRSADSHKHQEQAAETYEPLFAAVR